MAHHANAGLVHKLQRAHKFQRVMQAARRVAGVVILLAGSYLIPLREFADARTVGAYCKHNKPAARQLHGITVHALVGATGPVCDNNSWQAVFVRRSHRVVQFPVQQGASRVNVDLLDLYAPKIGCQHMCKAAEK